MTWFGTFPTFPHGVLKVGFCQKPPLDVRCGKACTTSPNPRKLDNILAKDGASHTQVSCDAALADPITRWFVLQPAYRLQLISADNPISLVKLGVANAMQCARQ
jgi:hypothetical protein